MEEKDVVKKRAKKSIDTNTDKTVKKVSTVKKSTSTKLNSEKNVSRKVDDGLKSPKSKATIIDEKKKAKTIEKKEDLPAKKSSKSKSNIEKNELDKNESKNSKEKLPKKNAKKVSKKLEEDADFNDIFENSLNELKRTTTKRDSNKLSKSNIGNKEAVKDAKASISNKNNLKLNNKKADSEEVTTKKKSVSTSGTKKRNNTSSSTTPKKTSTSSKVATKAAGVKKKITEEVAKTGSEKSSKIKINKKDDEKKKDGQVLKNTNNKASTEKKIKENKKIEDDYKKDLNINYFDDELESKFDLNELDKELKRRKSIPKEDKLKLIKKASFNMIFAAIFIVFLIFNNYGYYNFSKIAFIKDLNIFSFVFLGVSIMLIESSYKQENTEKCINGIETLLMGIFTLALPYIYQIYNNTFINAIKSAAIIIFGYYLIKSCIVFYNIKNKYYREKEDFVKEENNDSEFDDDFDDEEYDD